MSNPFADEIDIEAVLNALDDPACREIIAVLDEPHTADEVAGECDIARSTVYRKLDMLAEASLVEESTELRTDGHHTTRYVVDFEAVHVLLAENRDLSVEVDRPAGSPEERVAKLWQEVRDST
ncbi:winged helix-turn-helix domain-containing protein [Halosegnis marinus]|uniref:Helix-turn-helix domain-containing protein n=1 Tax=Halosegnis marinus TaxID=3034023 RepID=A0ABD5ZMZ6_9EURY|nr:helix-turn-helix domain-containing protein [Halosegnis sp. DT85]